MVNVGRGAVIDEAALIEALVSGKLRALRSRLRHERCRRRAHALGGRDVIVSPHTSALSWHENERIIELFADNLRRYLERRGAAQPRTHSLSSTERAARRMPRCSGAERRAVPACAFSRARARRSRRGRDDRSRSEGRRAPCAGAPRPTTRRRGATLRRRQLNAPAPVRRTAPSGRIAITATPRTCRDRQQFALALPLPRVVRNLRTSELLLRRLRREPNARRPW